MILLSMALLGQAAAEAEAPVDCALAVEAKTVGISMPTDFEGLSFEEPTIISNKTGGYYFSSKNMSLVRLLRLIGVKSLRFGGTTVDGKDYQISHSDVDNLFDFAKVVEAKAIYSLRLRNYPGEDKKAQYEREAQDAQYIMEKYGDQLDCFSLGNEPNVFYKGYKPFCPDWTLLSAAVNAVAPQAKFCGPGSWNSTENSWVIPFAEQFGGQKNIAYINEHIYQSQAPKYRPPLGSGDAEVARQQQLARTEMLAKSDYTTYYDRLVPALQKLGLAYRIEETNSFSGGGVPNASNAYAASLWGLNYQLWWASHGAKGINFHTGAHNVNSDQFSSYSVFSSASDGTQSPLGLAYAMLAFKLGAQGQMLDAKLSKSAPNFNATAYSLLGRDGSVYVTLVNQEWGSSGRSAAMTLHLPSFAVARVQSMALIQSASDVSFTPGVSPSGNITLGGSSIEKDGTWLGKWSAPSAPTDMHTVRIIVPAASALLVKLSPTAP